MTKLTTERLEQFIANPLGNPLYRTEQMDMARQLLVYEQAGNGPVSDEITIEELQYRIHAHENDLTQMWTADYFLNVQKELLALKQAAKNPVAWRVASFSGLPTVTFYEDVKDSMIANGQTPEPLYASPILPKQPGEITFEQAMLESYKLSPAEAYQKAWKAGKPVLPKQPELMSIGELLQRLEEQTGEKWVEESEQPAPMAFDEAWENKGHLFVDNKQYAALFYWLGYKAAPAQLVSEPYKLPELNDELIEILGRPNFTCTKLAECLRNCGQHIKRKSEHEQAAVLHVLLTLYIKHGNDWRKHAEEAFTPAVAQESE